MSRDHDPPTNPLVPKRGAYRSLNRKVPLRFAAYVLAMVFSVLVGFLPNPPSEQVQMLVLGLAVAFVGGDTMRPSNTVREG